MNSKSETLVAASVKPKFWKLSQGKEEFDYADIIESISKSLVYVHNDTGAKGRSAKSQAQDFIDAPIGEYFYLTYGNSGVYLLGQFSGPANIFSKYKEGWLDRKFEFIAPSITNKRYSGEQKWWAPNDNSTFTSVPEEELMLFEKEILDPYFGLNLKEFGV